ncbi:MAG: hypothetical protein MUP02_01640 [Actinobacteria bacterium]|nr:hypothetical protein [Actinomycetota bacterium]
MYPFSFRKYLKLKRIENQKPEHLTSSQKMEIYIGFLEYFINGGFPLILKNDDIELSRQYFEDILNKDILNRYKVREVKELKDLILFLFSNVGGIYSYSTLKKVSGIKSLSTIKNLLIISRRYFCYIRLENLIIPLRNKKYHHLKYM